MSSPADASYPSSLDDKESDKAVAREESYAEAPFRGKSWFRGALFQATVAGACEFLSPGIWNAM